MRGQQGDEEGPQICNYKRQGSSPRYSCVTVGRFLNVSKPQFPLTLKWGIAIA